MQRMLCVHSIVSTEGAAARPERVLCVHSMVRRLGGAFSMERDADRAERMLCIHSIDVQSQPPLALKGCCVYTV